jgi:hypothetical protein
MRFRRERVHRALAIVALGLAALAAASGGDALLESPPPRVGALELARWIRDGEPEVRVIAVQADTQTHETLVIPGAELKTLGEVARESWQPGSAVVLYAENEALADRARSMVPASARANAYVLRDGVAGWVRTIASPILPTNPSPEQAAQWQEIAELSRWFGGVPRVGEASTDTDSLRAAVARIRRRGC